MALGATVHKMILDPSQLKEGATISRKEMGLVKKVLRETETSSEKAARELDDLAGIYEKGAIDAKTYARAVDKIETEQKQATKSTKGLGTEVAGTGSALGGIASSLATANPLMIAAATAAIGAAAAYKGFEVVVSGVSESFERLDTAMKESRVLGMEMNELEAFRNFASEFAGVDSAGADKVLEDLRKKLGEAERGSESAARAFEELGLSSARLASLPTAQAAREVASAFRDHADGAKEASIAAELFGDQGMKMLPALNAGGVALDSQTRKVDLLRGSLSSVETDAIENANDQMARFGTVIDSTFDKMAVAVAGPLGDIVEEGVSLAIVIRDSAGEFKGLGREINSLTELATGGLLPTLEEIPATIAAGVGLMSDMASIAEGIIKLHRGQFKEGGAAILKGVNMEGTVAAQLKYLKTSGELRIQAQAEEQAKMKIEQKSYLDTETELVKNAESERTKAISDHYQKRIDAAGKYLDRRTAMEDMAAKRIMAAEKAIAEQAKKAKTARDAIAAGPGAGMEAGSAAAVSFLASQQNERLAARAMPAAPVAAQDEIVNEAKQQLEQAKKQTAQGREQLAALQRLITAAEENGFRRVG